MSKSEIQKVESSQSMIRIVGLSATLPNYRDVAEFLWYIFPQLFVKETPHSFQCLKTKGTLLL
jgi:hypothetical protein